MLPWLATTLLVASGYQVEVDWSEVSDRTIEACSLRAFGNFLVPALVDRGYAAVEAIGDHGFVVKVWDRDEQLFVRVSSQGHAREQAMAIPAPCDATFQSEIQFAVVQLLSEVAELVPAEPAPPAPPAPPPPAPPPESEPAPVVAEPKDDPGWLLGAGVVVAGSETFLGSVRFAPGLESWPGLVTRLVLDVAMSFGTDLTVVEPALGAQVSHALSAGPFEISFGLEAALLVHLFHRQTPHGVHVDGRVALPVRVGWSGWHLEVAVLGRLRETIHEIGGTREFVAGNLGGWLTAYVEL